MTAGAQGLLMIAGLFVLLAMGLPIAMALVASGVVAILSVQGWSAADYLLGALPYSGAAEFAFIVIPLFLFMGHMAFSAGVSERGFRAALAWFGHIPGGLGIAAVSACAAFATVSGSSIATAATVAKVAVPEMLKAGYSKRLAGAAVATGGTLGVLIPPSSVMVLYSIATETPIPHLFMAGIVPGILTAVLYAVLIHMTVRRDPSMKELTVLPRAPMKQRLRLTLSSWEIILLFAVVMGTLYAGLATATEAAGYGALAALAVALARGTRWEEVKKGLQVSGASTASIFFLIIGAGIFSVALATTQMPQQIATAVTSLQLPPVLLMILLLLPFLVLGCFIDAASMVLLTMPIIFPIVKQAGIDPVLFGILVVKMTEIGNITPPVGLNVFVVSTTCPEIPVREAFRGVLPFFVVELVVVALLIAFPSLTLGLVR
ncbi:TRAP transporter large permease [Ramlibacter alkalitolerans]|uniref:TRAP transporter large permease protein n=1 Tax=Ramlibacter alkalitolerans TaxID=2039631 RepID=A0ABS1JK46_9BURK|nr:TRAP transporter large permease [Ramlibacter alkalitolerans]MBL0424556.1 TRAP transporter large permease [Ramlibacter alkalitolerans]